MLAHLLLAINALLSSPDTIASELFSAALRSVGSIVGHCCKVMGLLVQACRQVWIMQSPFSESCRAPLRHLPLVPGQIFGPAAQEGLDWRLIASEAWWQKQSTFKVPGHSPYSFHRGTFHCCSLRFHFKTFQFKVLPFAVFCSKGVYKSCSGHPWSLTQKNAFVCFHTQMISFCAWGTQENYQTIHNNFWLIFQNWDLWLTRYCW